MKYLKHDDYFQIQLSKTPPQFDEALGYLTYTAFICTRQEVLSIVLKYGRQLLVARPKAFTQLLIQLCTGDLECFVPSATTSGGGNKRQTSIAATIALSATSTHAAPTAEELENIWTSDFWRVVHGLLSSANKLQALSSLTSSPHHESIVSPQDVLGLYHNFESELLILLDGILSASKGRVLAPKIWMTVLELYMQKYQEASIQVEQFKLENRNIIGGTQSHETTEFLYELQHGLKVIEQTIMGYLDGPTVQYDSGHVLLLCHLFGFEKGEKYLLEKQNHVDLLMQRMTEVDDVKEILKLLRKEGTKEPELYVQVLTYFVQRTSNDSSRERKSRLSIAEANGTNPDSDDDDVQSVSSSDEDENNDNDAKYVH
jgi:hypothetical protein